MRGRTRTGAKLKKRKQERPLSGQSEAGPSVARDAASISQAKGVEGDMCVEKKPDDGDVTSTVVSGKRAKKKGLVDERLLRLQADFENFRKRTLKEKNELYRRANEDLLQELLPVLDHFELAFSSIGKHASDKAFTEGVRLVSEQLLSVLGKFGLVPIEAEGQPFDPNSHEAISYMAADDVAENIVISQTRRGYMVGHRLLRPTQVVVSSGPAAKQTSRADRQDQTVVAAEGADGRDSDTAEKNAGS